MELWAVLLAIAISFVVVLPVALYYAWAAAWLWLWFVVPVFNAPVVSIWQMWGLMLFLALIRPVNYLKDERGVDWNKVAFLLVGPLVSLGLGWVVYHHLIGVPA